MSKYNDFLSKYDDDFLLDRLFNQIENEKVENIKIIRPTCERKDRKTYLVKFRDFCFSVRRDEKDVQHFLEKHARDTSSILESGALLMNKMYQPSEINDLINKYIASCVTCQEQKCGSLNTEIIKKNRIVYIKCNACYCERAVLL